MVCRRSCAISCPQRRALRHVNPCPVYHKHFYRAACIDSLPSLKLAAGCIAGKSAVKFNLIDKIELLTDERIVAVKYVSLAEEYLADHFPTFPVLPGVMMLEALTQAAGWLLHRRHRFAKS